MKDPDHYATLGVSAQSEPEVIRAAYRALMRKYHPDSNPAPDATQRCIQINAAFEILADPVARAAYDRSRPSVIEVETTANPPTQPAHRRQIATKRIRLNEQDPVSFLVGLVIPVIVITALVRLAVLALPQSKNRELPRHHCMVVLGPGETPRPSQSQDCPMIETVVAPPSSPANQ